MIQHCCLYPLVAIHVSMFHISNIWSLGIDLIFHEIISILDRNSSEIVFVTFHFFFHSKQYPVPMITMQLKCSTWTTFEEFTISVVRKFFFSISFLTFFHGNNSIFYWGSIDRYFLADIFFQFKLIQIFFSLYSAPISRILK